MYADDVQFLHQGPISDLPELQETVESTVAAAHSWFNENCLKINPNKTDLTVIKSTKRKATSEFSIRFGDASIRPSPTVKVLGMTVDGGLTFEAHVSGVVRRCYATLGGLSKMTGKLPEAVKKNDSRSAYFPTPIILLYGVGRMQQDTTSPSTESHKPLCAGSEGRKTVCLRVTAVSRLKMAISGLNDC